MTTSLKLLAGFAVAASVAIAAGLAFVYSGYYDVAATTPHFDTTFRLMKVAMRQSVQRHARGVAVPELDDPVKVHSGFRNFHGMCVACHGAPGSEPSEIAKGLYPRAPDLSKTASSWTPAELFVIIKNGIKMSGMPAWEPTHSGDEMWALVAFLRQYPTMPAGEYQEAVRYYEATGKTNEMHHH